MTNTKETAAGYFDYESRPWLKYYGNTPSNLTYSTATMYEQIAEVAKRKPDYTAYGYINTTGSYKKFLLNVDRLASALSSTGLGAGDKIAIALPNIPQCIFAFYAANKLGLTCVMIHPLSSAGEMDIFLSGTSPKLILTADMFYDNFAEVIMKNNIKTTVLCRIQDELTFPIKTVLNVSDAIKSIKKRVPKKGKAIYYKEFIKRAGEIGPYESVMKSSDVAAILYSGGTSGDPKGMMLSNLNFNAIGAQIAALYEGNISDTECMITVLPMFHGFGLACCVHAILMLGGSTILIPRFEKDGFIKTLKKYRPTFFAGPPTMFGAVLSSKKQEGLDLSSLKGVFSGGDKLPDDLKTRFDEFLKTHNASIHIREGYGLTETVSACALTPDQEFRSGSVGIPFSDTYVKICKPSTEDDLSIGEHGEIYLSTPSLMLGYINDDKENDDIIKIHSDGRRWLHTGDMGYVDADGFIYFCGRIKRIIKINAYTIYPAVIEDVVNDYDAVNLCCAVSFVDDKDKTRIKIYIELKEGFTPSDQLKTEILLHCKEKLNVWSRPKVVEFIDKMPKTKVGKIDYKML